MCVKYILIIFRLHSAPTSWPPLNFMYSLMLAFSSRNCFYWFSPITFSPAPHPLLLHPFHPNHHSPLSVSISPVPYGPYFCQHDTHTSTSLWVCFLVSQSILNPTYKHTYKTPGLIWKRIWDFLSESESPTFQIHLFPCKFHFNFHWNWKKFHCVSLSHS